MQRQPLHGSESGFRYLSNPPRQQPQQTTTTTSRWETDEEVMQRLGDEYEARVRARDPAIWSGRTDEERKGLQGIVDNGFRYVTYPQQILNEHRRVIQQPQLQQQSHTQPRPQPLNPLQQQRVPQQRSTHSAPSTVTPLLQPSTSSLSSTTQPLPPRPSFSSPPPPPPSSSSTTTPSQPQPPSPSPSTILPQYRYSSSSSTTTPPPPRPSSSSIPSSSWRSLPDRPSFQSWQSLYAIHGATGPIYLDGIRQQLVDEAEQKAFNRGLPPLALDTAGVPGYGEPGYGMDQDQLKAWHNMRDTLQSNLRPLLPTMSFDGSSESLPSSQQYTLQTRADWARLRNSLAHEYDYMAKHPSYRSNDREAHNEMARVINADKAYLQEYGRENKQEQQQQQSNGDTNAHTKEHLLLQREMQETLYINPQPSLLTSSTPHPSSIPISMPPQSQPQPPPSTMPEFVRPSSSPSDTTLSLALAGALILHHYVNYRPPPRSSSSSSSSSSASSSSSSPVVIPRRLKLVLVQAATPSQTRRLALLLTITHLIDNLPVMIDLDDIYRSVKWNRFKTENKEYGKWQYEPGSVDDVMEASKALKDKIESVTQLYRWRRNVNECRDICMVLFGNLQPEGYQVLDRSFVEHSGVDIEYYGGLPENANIYMSSDFQVTIDMKVMTTLGRILWDTYQGFEEVYLNLQQKGIETVALLEHDEAVFMEKQLIAYHSQLNVYLRSDEMKTVIALRDAALDRLLSFPSVNNATVELVRAKNILVQNAMSQADPVTIDPLLLSVAERNRFAKIAAKDKEIEQQIAQLPLDFHYREKLASLRLQFSPQYKASLARTGFVPVPRSS